MCAARWLQTGDGITRLKVPSTSSRDIPSVITSVGVPIKPSQSPPHRSRAASCDFVHWRFSYACRRRVWTGGVMQASENLHIGRNRYRDSRCAGCLADSVVTAESIDSGEGRAIHYGGSSQIFSDR